AGLRVLDLADAKGALCGRLLADMGADVIKIEPPRGDQSRKYGPFFDDQVHHDKNLFFWFYNLNKRSLTLDLSRPRAVDLLKQLVCSSDVVIESYAAGTIERMGLGFEDLRAVNPAVILCSIAPFGQTGPYSDFEADDTVLAALSGML